MGRWPAQATDEELVDVCGLDPSWLCEATWNVSHNRALTRLVDGVLTPILTAIVVLVIAALINRWLRRFVTSFIGQVTRKDRVAGAYLGKLGVVAVDEEREKVRATTLSAVARTTVSAFIWFFAALAILGIFSINLGPLIAGAGIAGIAVGLGAQQLVKDCIAGFFILLEDQCGVGDEIDIGPAIGTVESITLRATTLRDSAGTVWTVPNGTVLRIGNKSRDWSLGTVDVTVADAAQLDDAVAVIERVAGRGVGAARGRARPARTDRRAWRGELGHRRSGRARHRAHRRRGAGASDAHAARRPHPRARRRRHRLGLLVPSTVQESLRVFC